MTIMNIYPGEHDEMSVTLSLKNALEWLKTHSTDGQVTEYELKFNKISKTYTRIWSYDNTGEPTLVCEDNIE
jgi:hypothetical protein